MIGRKETRRSLRFEQRFVQSIAVKVAVLATECPNPARCWRGSEILSGVVAQDSKTIISRSAKRLEYS